MPAAAIRARSRLREFQRSMIYVARAMEYSLMRANKVSSTVARRKARGARPGSTGAMEPHTLMAVQARPDPMTGLPRTRTGTAATPLEAREPPGQTDALDEALLEGFSHAVQAAIAKAHASGLAVPGRDDNGRPVEHHPGGRIAAIDEKGAWSPEDWKNRA